MKDFDPFRDVKDFHVKHGLAYLGGPRLMPGDLAEFRFKFGLEELEEFQRSNQAGLVAESSGDRLEALEGVLDSYVDQLYVLLGTIYLSGMNQVFEEAWHRVHEKNMEKVRVNREGDSKRGSLYDVVKPEGWTPPVFSDLLMRYAQE